MLADTAQRTVGGQRWWQRFETDVELGGFSLSPLAIAGWTIVGGIFASLAARDRLPGVSGACSSASPRRSSRAGSCPRRVSEDAQGIRGAARRQPRRARWRHAHGSSRRWALSASWSTALDRAVEDRVPPRAPGRAARRSARRCSHGDGTHVCRASDAEQIALVMRLQREAGGNTAEVLDRVAEVIRGRMELRRLVDVLTAQARISRWILTSLADRRAPHAHRSPAATTSIRCLTSLVGRIALVVGGDHGAHRVVLDQANLETGRVTMGIGLIAVCRCAAPRSRRHDPRRQPRQVPRVVGDDRPDPDVRLRRGGYGAARRPSLPRGAPSTRSQDASATGLASARRPLRRGRRSATSSSPPGMYGTTPRKVPRLPGPLRDRVLALSSCGSFRRWAARSIFAIVARGRRRRRRLVRADRTTSS